MAARIRVMRERVSLLRADAELLAHELEGTGDFVPALERKFDLMRAERWLDDLDKKY